MKKVIRLAQFIAVAAFAVVSISANGQTGENPKPKNNPRGGTQPSNPKPSNPQPTQPTQPTQPPIMLPPIIVPGQVYYPPTQQSGNFQNIPSKSPEQIARENREAAKNQVMKEMFQMSADVQEFEITDLTKPFHVKGIKGFDVHFPEFAFVDEEGNPVLGDVTIKLTEYTTLSEFAASGLSTMTTDGEILETGGMINLEVKSGDKSVKLANGKEVTITVPNVDSKKGFRTYYGYGTEQITWSTEPAQNGAETDKEPFDGYTIKMLKPNGNAYGDRISMTFYKNGESLETFVNSSLKVSNDVKKKILKSGIPFVYTIEFNALGKIKSVAPKNRELTDKTLISSLNSQIISLLKSAPAFNMTDGNLMAGKSYDVIFATVKNHTDNQVNIAPPLSFPAKAENEKPTETNVNEMTMKSSSLQKINCDRLSGYASTDTAIFHFERADALVYIIIKDMRAMVNPTGANGDYMMSKIPAGTPVRYVAVVYDDMGNVHISSKDTTFQKGKVNFETQIPFSPFNLQGALEAP